MPAGPGDRCPWPPVLFSRLLPARRGVTIIALGALLFPALQQAGYPEKFNLGLVTSAGSLGLLFAPSLPLILYGVVAEIAVEDLFLAGVLPGFLMLVTAFGLQRLEEPGGAGAAMRISPGRRCGSAAREAALGNSAADSWCWAGFTVAISRFPRRRQ